MFSDETGRPFFSVAGGVDERMEELGFKNTKVHAKVFKALLRHAPCRARCGQTPASVDGGRPDAQRLDPGDLGDGADAAVLEVQGALVRTGLLQDQPPEQPERRLVQQGQLAQVREKS